MALRGAGLNNSQTRLCFEQNFIQSHSRAISFCFFSFFWDTCRQRTGQLLAGQAARFTAAPGLLRSEVVFMENPKVS